MIVLVMMMMMIVAVVGLVLGVLRGGRYFAERVHPAASSVVDARHGGRLDHRGDGDGG